MVVFVHEDYRKRNSCTPDDQALQMVIILGIKREKLLVGCYLICGNNAYFQTSMLKAKVQAEVFVLCCGFREDSPT